MGLILAILLAALVEALTPASPSLQPVTSASRRDWNPTSFWHPHWGESGVHKGIDIFAERGRPVRAAQAGWVLYTGEWKRGGQVAILVTPRLWFHYYAHLDRVYTQTGAWLAAGDPVGTVGNSGNAAGKPPHLHYAILTLVPRLWEAHGGAQGWRRMFYRDPGDYW